MVIDAAMCAIDVAASTGGTFTVFYTVAASGGCGILVATKSVIIKKPSVGASSVTSTVASGCDSAIVTLTANGGTLGSGAIFKWYKNSCGGTVFRTGKTITDTAGTTATYYVRIEGDCNTTECVSITIPV